MQDVYLSVEIGLDIYIEEVFWVHKTSLTPPLFIEVPVPSHTSAQSCICVLGVSIFFSFYVFRLDFGTVLTGWYCFGFFPILLIRYTRVCVSY